MTINPQQLQQLLIGSEEEKVEYLRSLLNYPIKLQDPKGSQFWFLRPGDTETCPLAVGFCWELDSLDTQNLKKWLTEEEQDRNIRGHYINSLIPDQPVLYLLLPHSPGGKVGFILPCEGKLRQRNIQIFPWGSNELLTQLERLNHNTLTLLKKIENNLLGFIPQIDWIFYPPSQTAQELAQALAVVTRRIEEAIPEVYHRETKDGYLHKLLDSFQKELLPNLQLKSDNDKDYSFADIYAQTIAYGLFTARVFSFVKDHQQYFNSDHAWQQLPETNPFLKKLFQDISQQSPTELGDELIDAISETFGILRAAKMEEILVDFRNKMNQEDIVIRFYEDFLAAYKPTMREKRGVYYTPEPVVSYMVRSVDELLKDKFNKPLGLADPEVMILDPACGTGTFLLWIFRLIHQRFQENPEVLTQGLEDQSWNSYVRHRLLPRVFGFELLMAPYAICHLKLGLFLEETGYQFDSGKRLGVYLLNTLEDIKLREEKDQFTLDIPQMEELIATEAKEGSRIKKNEPIMVVIGNPPYSYASSNNGEWISELVRDYYQVDGQPLNEANPKGLQDDYVKFIRFAQWRIDKSGQGILAFITNHGFLDNPTFRGMRQSLINSFEGISVYDLHGNSKKKETCPDGSKDENVFDIQQGVSICLAVKGKDKYINHGNLYGLREDKYQLLSQKTIKKTIFTEITPQSSFYLLIPQNAVLLPEYNSFWAITDIFLLHSTGILTARDHFTIQDSKEKLWEIVQDFINLPVEVARSKYQLREDVRDWKVSFAQRDIINSGNDFQKIVSYLYRPFDFFFTYFTGNSRGFHCTPRGEVMQHMAQNNNLGLVTVRQVAERVFNHVLVTNTLIDCRITLSNKGYGYLFPLYLYPNLNHTKELQQTKRPNFSPDFLKIVETKLGYLPTPEEIFYYIYAIFHSPTYRIRYAEFLKIDFPRVPLTTDNNLFRQLSGYGEQLAQLHLMESPLLNNLITQFTQVGNREVIAGHPKYQEGNIYINKTDYFTGVPENVWNFYVGGYQVCQKWLKDRKGRTLSDEDILHYQKIVVALQETIKLMELIDQAIPGFPIT